MQAGAGAKAGGASTVLGAEAPIRSPVALPWLHCELRHVATEDGTLVPVTLLHRRGLCDSAAAAAHPTLLTVYGACE